MTLRIKLARWIGGKELEALFHDQRIGLDRAEFRRLEAEGRVNGYKLLEFKRRKALESIAAPETPKANATVRNMARIAREALK